MVLPWIWHGELIVIVEKQSRETKKNNNDVHSCRTFKSAGVNHINAKTNAIVK